MKAGDRVTWTHQSINGSSIVLRSWEGMLEEDLTESKIYVRIRRKGRIYRVHKAPIRASSERGHLTELVMGKQSR